MKIKMIVLDNFRNHIKRAFEFSDAVTIISGPNGSGKTNMLEALFLLSIGKSSRAVLEKELVNINSNYARIIGNFIFADSNKAKLEAVIVKKETPSRVQKIFRINGTIKSGTEFVGTLKAVLFAPEDIRLIAGSPSRRRDYLDRLLSQVHYEYHKNLLKYNRILRHRNKVLDQMRGQVFKSIYETQLGIWNTQLIESGTVIQEIRSRFFEYAKIHLGLISQNLYKKNHELFLNYRKSYLTEKNLNNVRQKELIYGITQIGPHRDDYSFYLSNNHKMDLKGYGSRGQQRTGVLCIKILEIQYIRDISESKPVLLLDDIFSELDENYRGVIEKVIASQQTVITTADLNMVPENIKNNARIIQL